MPSYKAPIDDFAFLLHDYLATSDYRNITGFADGLDVAIPLMNEGAKWCEDVLFPLNMTGDQEGCRFENGNVIMPKGFKEAYQQYCDAGWSRFTCDPTYGGQGLPELLNMPMTEMICSANLSFGLTPGLSHSAYNLLARYLSEPMKARYLPNLIAGTWTGVMCLTEPQCGTDLGLIRTTATPHADGSYHISGTKIFISSGEHDLSDNILHLVLAKLPDAPAGTKGISLFLVSKYAVHNDGSLGERNHVHCASIEEKMGIHASSTCVMNYDDAVGYLIGEPHQGLKAMFVMMNAARIYVGVQGLGLMEVAQQNALAYCQERLQGRAATGATAPHLPADPITAHPDVRKMLLTMRAYTQGCRALLLETTLHYDLSLHHPDRAQREKSDAFVQLMTPIVKAFLTDCGHEVTNLAMQCLGGYGYIREYGLEQYARDARIAQIYEGTNGIQAMDLVGRKLPHQMGAYLAAFFVPAQEFVENPNHPSALQPLLTQLTQHMNNLRKATLWLAREGQKNPNQALAGATEYLRIFALSALGFAWCRQAALVYPNINQGNDPQGFYQDKWDTAQFFMNRLAPQTYSLLASMTAGSESIMKARI